MSLSLVKKDWGTVSGVYGTLLEIHFAWSSFRLQNSEQQDICPNPHTHTHTLTTTLSDQPLEMKPVKRKRGDRGEESEEETNGVAPPINDIYRARQQKRVHTATWYMTAV